MVGGGAINCNRGPTGSPTSTWPNHPSTDLGCLLGGILRGMLGTGKQFVCRVGNVSARVR